MRRAALRSGERLEGWQAGPRSSLLFEHGFHEHLGLFLRDMFPLPSARGKLGGSGNMTGPQLAGSAVCAPDRANNCRHRRPAARPSSDFASRRSRVRSRLAPSKEVPGNRCCLSRPTNESYTPGTKRGRSARANLRDPTFARVHPAGWVRPPQTGQANARTACGVVVRS
jgi:hypothetical protein